ncbi:SDR family oxidoreductase [Nonomuraea salmonea]|uniref:SDR family oxidoreductase n=1 Tax=Nonomuraea salmonea TaxID=46181 RepID=UPI002FE91247
MVHRHGGRGRSRRLSAHPRPAPGGGGHPPAFADLPAGFKERIAAQVPIGRLGEGAETATAALFLACADSSFVTGIGLPVDGGIGQV